MLLKSLDKLLDDKVSRESVNPVHVQNGFFPATRTSYLVSVRSSVPHDDCLNCFRELKMCGNHLCCRKYSGRIFYINYGRTAASELDISVFLGILGMAFLFLQLGK